MGHGHAYSLPFFSWGRRGNHSVCDPTSERDLGGSLTAFPLVSSSPAARRHGKAGETALHEGERILLCIFPAQNTPMLGAPDRLTLPSCSHPAPHSSRAHPGARWLPSSRPCLPRARRAPSPPCRARVSRLWVSSWVTGVGFTSKYVSPTWVSLLSVSVQRIRVLHAPLQVLLSGCL